MNRGIYPQHALSLFWSLQNRRSIYYPMLQTGEFTAGLGPLLAALDLRIAGI